MKTPGAEPASPVDEKQPKVSYPSLNLSNKVADSFLKECDADLGDEITATVCLKITSLRKDEYGNSVGFDVLSLEDISGTDDDDKGDEKPDAEEETLGYKRPKQSAKESPDISADSLKD